MLEPDLVSPIDILFLISECRAELCTNFNILDSLIFLSQYTNFFYYLNTLTRPLHNVRILNIQ